MKTLVSMLLALATILLSGVYAEGRPGVAAESRPSLHLVLREKNWHRSMGVGGADQVAGVTVGAGDIYDQTGSTQVGKIYLTFLNIEVEEGKAKSIFSSGIIRLEKGDLAVESLVSVAEDATNKTHRYIVTGGTGVYANVRGYGVNRFDENPSFQEMWLSY